GGGGELVLARAGADEAQARVRRDVYGADRADPHARTGGAVGLEPLAHRPAAPARDLPGPEPGRTFETRDVPTTFLGSSTDVAGRLPARGQPGAEAEEDQGGG